LQIKERRMWPALILANKRKDRVIGRTNNLTNSTKERNGTRYQGEFTGSTLEEILGLKNKNKSLATHNVRATIKFNANVVVTGKE